MDGAWLARLRWRRRGAWLWPAFVATAVADALIGHALPPSGDSQTVIGAALIGTFFNLLAVLILSRPIGALARRRDPSLPKLIAKNYGGTAAVLAVAAILATVGLIHRSTVDAHRRAMADAIARAQAWIGDRAPAEFRRNVQFVSTFTIEPGKIYRTCVPSATNAARTYCVIVKMQLPFARSVTFDGYESNSVFGAGTG
jgi:hypothetical protein